MIYVILFLASSFGVQDSVLPPRLIQLQRQVYKKQIAINGLFSIGLTATSGIYWKKGNDAYDLYQKSTKTTDALHYWEQTTNYDRIRNVCAIGALFFIGRTIYYYAKLMDTGKTVGSLPSLDLWCAYNGTISFGLTKRF
jgi:hypothetical protein